MMMDPKPGRVVADWVRSLPLKPARAIEKSLPDIYVNSNREFLTGLIDGLFSTDGSVDLQSNHPLLRFHTASLELARQVRRILLMFGIYGRISTTIRKRHDINGRFIQNDHPKYDVTIAGDSLGRFFEQFRLSHKPKQMRLEDAALRSNFTGGNWAAKVINIEPAGVDTVYDLYEPRSDTWITEGFVSRGCGEQWLGPYENCCLGSVNLAQHMGSDHSVDWEKLRQNVELSTIFLDDVVEANAYVPAVPQLEDAAHRARRIGLGIMGLGDLMYHLGVRYGSDEGQEFAAQVMEFVRYHSMKTSISLAEQRGAFPAIQGSLYDPDNTRWTPPAPLQPYTRSWGRPVVDWSEIMSGIQMYGIRNAAQTTIAPTGTIATVAGCEGYGCEPVFALAYIRHVNDNGKDLQLTYTSPQFEDALIDAGLDESARSQVISKMMDTGTCKDIPGVPAEIANTFVVSSDITADEHVRMQAAMQAFVDNSLSKTVNFPAGATIDQVATAYQLAWQLGCKGITVYVTGSRQVVVLETKETVKQKEAAQANAALAESTQVEPAPVGTTAPATDVGQLKIWHDTKKPRPRRLPGYTFTVNTPLGKAFITINENGGSQPFEVFINTAKAGSDTAAVSEAIGRLVSYVLRLPSPISPRERLEEVVNQLNGIGGGRSLGFGPNRIRSLPDGVSHALAEYLEETSAILEQKQSKSAPTKDNGFHPAEEKAAKAALSEEIQSGQQFMRIGDLCPECGQAAVVNEEGCRKCYACGYSEC
jgi:ribonucleoside-diphosphate reductase alpha chain